MPKVSVIIPVYGVEDYIEQCAESLFQQTLDNIEFLFIDDCSKDNSMNILSAVIEKKRACFAEKKWEVRVVRMPANSGQAAVRRYGVQLASGQFVIHCDSDDWIEPAMYESMYNIAKKDDADIVVCDYFEGKTSDVIAKSLPDGVQSNIEICAKVLSHRASCSTWNKLVKRDIYNNDIFFPVYNYGEDMTLMSQLLFYSKKISYIAQPFYHYRYNDNSISKNKSKDGILKSYKHTCGNVDLLDSFFKEKCTDKRIKQAMVSLKAFERNRLLPLIGEIEFYRQWINTYPEINKILLFNKYIPLRNKVGYIVGLLRLYPYLSKFVH